MLTFSPDAGKAGASNKKSSSKLGLSIFRDRLRLRRPDPAENDGELRVAEPAPVVVTAPEPSRAEPPAVRVPDPPLRAAAQPAPAPVMGGDGLVIYASDHLRVIYRPAGSAHLVVTFNSMAKLFGGSDFWARDALEREDVSALGFVASRPNWFPEAEMTRAIAALAAAEGGSILRRHDRIITYGFSMGGYGALKYAARLGADVALAFTPQFSIDPAEVDPADRRYTQFFDPALNAAMAVTAADLGARNFVVYDPASALDRAQAEMLGRFDRLERVILPCALHDTIRVVTESRLGADLLRLLAERDLSAATLRRLFRSGRARSRTYRTGLDDRVRAHGPAWTGIRRRLLQAWQDIDPTALRPLIGLTELQMEEAGPAAAEPGLRTLWQSRNRAPASEWWGPWRLFTFAGQSDKAGQFADRAVAADPANPIPRVHLARSLLDMGFRTAASDELDRVREAAGDRVEVWRHLSVFYQRLGRSEDAEQAAGHLARLVPAGSQT